MEKKFVSWRELTTQFEGRTISGSYAVDGGIIRVRFGGNIKTTQFAGSSAIVVAEQLLQKLARAAEE